MDIEVQKDDTGEFYGRFIFKGLSKHLRQNVLINPLLDLQIGKLSDTVCASKLFNSRISTLNSSHNIFHRHTYDQWNNALQTA